MRKLLLLILLAIMPVATYTASGANGIPSDKLMTVVNEYRLYDGFEVVKLNSLATKALKTAIRIAALGEEDKDIRELLKVITGIKKIAVVDYEDCSEGIRDSFNRKVGKILQNQDILMQVKDGSDSMTIYGVVSDDAGTVKDFVLFSPDNCALICLFGSISIDTVMRMVEEA